MSETILNNKRIAKNTIYLYFRMGITMVVSLYTSRVILAALGVEDFGIYNVIGGVVALFNVICGSLTVATGRFLSFALGTNDRNLLRDSFSTSLNIHILLGILIIALAEIFGIWFLNYKLNIPPVRMYAANWVLQCSIITFVINIINVPYSSAIICHEHMGIYAYLGMFDVCVKLLIVYALLITAFDKLITYAILLLIVNLVMQMIYYFYCKKKFPECRFHLTFNNIIIKQMFGFVGWAFLGNAAVVVKNQGVTILLNIFCGPVVNAAQGVANQVDSVVSRFVNGYMTASNPQIIKLYSSGESDEMRNLIMRSSRFSFFLVMLVMCPIALNIAPILEWWLETVPDHTQSFVILTMAYTALECLATPLVTGVLSTGKIKNFEIFITTLYLLMVLFVYLFLRLGTVPEVALIISIIIKTVVIYVLISFSSKLYNLNKKDYLRGVVIPIFPVSIIPILSLLLQVYSYYLQSTLLTSVISEAILVLIIWTMGMNKSERSFVTSNIKNKIKSITK